MKKYLFLISFIIIYSTINGQPGNYWKLIKEVDAMRQSKTKDPFANRYKPAEYKLFILDEAVFRTVLASAPLKHEYSAKSPFIITIPNADGNIEEFNLAEATIMEPELAAKYPDIKSYAGQSISNRGSTIRCDITPEGFHGIILSSNKKTIYINPIDKSLKLYAVYYRDDDRKQNFRCETDEPLSEMALGRLVAPAGNADDNKIRTYRFALVTTGEFSQYFLDGTENNDVQRKLKVFSAIFTEVVRLDAIYERDFDVNLVFVADEDTLLFLNPATDPYNVNEFLNTTQETCDKYIGTANYDIGHVVHRAADFGKSQYVGSVCKKGRKASAFTMYSHPDLLDYFVVDYLAHEIGHQFGANHTFTFSNESTRAQIEPGSASTIMGYAGITGLTDVQAHSDDYFSAASIAQVTNFIKSPNKGGKCPLILPTGNHAPTAAAGRNYTIPRSTPFMLTGKGSDSDIFDGLSYCWEQIDAYQAGSNTFPKTTSTTGPLFRSLPPTISTSRCFPDLQTILQGKTSNDWEALPSIGRDLNFRFTVRDNNFGGGSNISDDMKVTVTGSAGAFEITSPNNAVTWTVGDNVTIKWNVAFTNNAPINCQKVNILLSTDGGNTFDVTLARKTDNDGIEKIKVPKNTVTKKARVKIEAANNIFFDISNMNFEIQKSSGFAEQQYSEISGKPAWSVFPNPATDKIVLHFLDDAGKTGVLITNATGKILYRNTFSSVVSGQSILLPLSNFAGGVYFLKVITDKVSKTEKIVVNK